MAYRGYGISLVRIQPGIGEQVSIGLMQGSSRTAITERDKGMASARRIRSRARLEAVETSKLLERNNTDS